MTTQTIVTVIAAIAAPLGAYLLAARRFSGRIQTSDASSLWQESASIRQWSAERIAELSSTVRSLEKRVGELEAHNGDLLLANSRLQKELQNCKSQNK